MYPLIGTRIIAVKEKHIHVLGIALTTVYGAFIVFLYATEPRSLADVPGKARTTVESITTTGQILTGAYKIDQNKFDAGLAAFRRNDFIAARDTFESADPEKSDAVTQFYIAYSFYRQGWGRVSSDDAMFRQALEAVERARSLDPGLRVADADLKLHTPAELKAEIEEGLHVSAEDFNPLKVFRERK